MVIPCRGNEAILQTSLSPQSAVSFHRHLKTSSELGDYSDTSPCLFFSPLKRLHHGPGHGKVYQSRASQPKVR